MGNYAEAHEFSAQEIYDMQSYTSALDTYQDDDPRYLPYGDYTGDEDEYNELDEMERVLGADRKRPYHKNRAYRRRMFMKKEKHAPYPEYNRVQYIDNAKYVRKFLSALREKDFYEAQGVRMTVTERFDNGFDVLVENRINSSKNIVEVRMGKKRIPWLIYSTTRGWNPVYYKRFYPNRKGFKRIANKMVRRHKEYEPEDGYEVAFPKGRHFRKVFQTYDICEY